MSIGNLVTEASVGSTALLKIASMDVLIVLDVLLFPDVSFFDTDLDVTPEGDETVRDLAVAVEIAIRPSGRIDRALRSVLTLDIISKRILFDSLSLLSLALADLYFDQLFRSSSLSASRSVILA